MSNNKEKHDILSHPTSANGMLDYYEPDHRPKTAKELSLDYPVTVLDTRFQRYGGHEYGSGWSEKNAREFLRQFIGGKAQHQIVRVGVELNLNNMKNIRDGKHPKRKLESYDESDIEDTITYLEELHKKGIQYVSVDGHNGDSTNYNFIENVFSAHVDLPSGEQRKNVFFKDLSLRDQLYYELKEFRVSTLTCITQKEMHKLFVSMNQSTNLNPQEVRNGTPSNLAEFVRELSNTDSKDYIANLEQTIGSIPCGTRFFKTVCGLTEAKLHQRDHEKQTAELALKLQKNFSEDLTKHKLNLFYEKTSELSPKIKKDMEKIYEECEKFSDSYNEWATQNKVKGRSVIKELFKNKNSHAFMDFVQILVIEEDCKILDYWKILDKYSRFSAEQCDIYQKTPSAEEKTTFWWTKSRPSIKEYYNTYRKMLKGFIRKELPDWVDNELVSVNKAKSSGPRTANTKTAILAGVRQGFKTREGLEFGPLEQDSPEFHRGHLVSYKNGGSTSLQNTEIQTREMNLKQGSKDFEPAFDFQKPKPL